MNLEIGIKNTMILRKLNSDRLAKASWALV